MAPGLIEIAFVIALIFMFFGGAILAFVMKLTMKKSRGGGRAVARRKVKVTNPMWPLITAGICLAAGIVGLAFFVEYVVFG